MRNAPVLAAGIAAAAVLAAACGGGDEVRTQVFVAPPWTSDESYTYELVDEGDEQYGICTLETKVDAEPGRTRLDSLCGAQDRYRDDGSVLAESERLRPVSSRREVSDSKEEKRSIFAATYHETSVELSVDDNGKTRSTSRDLPEPSEDEPDPGYYDDLSIFWLVRGVPLQEGWSGWYANVNIGTARVSNVELRVEKQEDIETDVGNFRAWKVRIGSSSTTHFAWVNIEAPHQVVKARIESYTYQLINPSAASP